MLNAKEVKKGRRENVNLEEISKPAPPPLPAGLGVWVKE